MPIIEFLKGFSYFGIMLALSFEFIPAELVLPLAGYWVYQGDFNYYLVVLAGTIGGVIGPITLYCLGRFGGRPLVLRYGKYFLITPKQVDAADRFFAKYGGGVAFFGRFLPIVRTAVSVPCGLAKMSIVKFSLYTGLAMLPITALYVYIGLQLGEHWQDAAPLFNQYLKPVAFVIILLVVIFVIYKIINNSKKGYSKHG
ncbi:membrane protein DedA with SNARE-associated domain [Alkalihalobacillus xiaoxiensis]|uniref:Membrane protein DedA with SNARE-associated domain n=1 Tax=Shouchella xiaoxiensis TaxID=766895 RepID=A0ABS2SV06_9BACI|nr:DedA family protein [Shouchella xiaoxiensis]MBM7839346.1 membrane protein DedA with SNARE-associated domain [Shouchella xiaoxiensis]